MLKEGEKHGILNNLDFWTYFDSKFLHSNEISHEEINVKETFLAILKFSVLQCSKGGNSKFWIIQIFEHNMSSLLAAL